MFSPRAAYTCTNHLGRRCDFEGCGRGAGRGARDIHTGARGDGARRREEVRHQQEHGAQGRRAEAQDDRPAFVPGRQARA